MPLIRSMDKNMDKYFTEWETSMADEYVIIFTISWKSQKSKLKPWKNAILLQQDVPVLKRHKTMKTHYIVIVRV